MAIMKKKYIKPMVTSVRAAEEAIMQSASLFKYEETISDPKVLELLAFYRITRDDAEKAMRKADT